MALSELPLHHSFRLSSRSHLRLLPLRLLSSSRPASSSAAAASASPSSSSGNRAAPPAPSSGSPWLKKWAPSDPSQPPPAPAPSTSIDRIVHRLRNLGLGTDDDEPSASTATAAPDGNERLGDLLHRSWSRPDRQFAASSFDEAVLPWEKDEETAGKRGDEEDGVKRRRVKAPTLAELTIEDEELRRLRRLGMTLRDRITVPKAGVTQAVTEKIHDAWRKSELVRLKFHEDLANDMKTAHELVERRTGGLIIWRSGSVMVVYRGSNYKRPLKSQTLNGASSPVKEEDGALFIPDASSPAESDNQGKDLAVQNANVSQLNMQNTDDMTEEELEFNQMLDELGPRFVDWWGTGILPVDADLLPQTIPGYKTPYRLLPTGMRTTLTNTELTNLRKLARNLPCHFALGRNRNHQGLAEAIVKLWEKSLVVKIAVKRGIQNTNNKLMAEEIKNLTGGTLLLRNKFYIVIYRGKDFLPTSVASALAEREELTKDIQNVEEQRRSILIAQPPDDGLDGHALVGTLAEFQEAQARWGREVTAKEQEEMKEASSRSEKEKLFKKLEHKLSIAQAKMHRARRLLSKIEASMVLADPCDDREMITDEEKSVFRRIGLRLKSYLPLGIRGVFDGVIENMHLHWKHREVVKLISKQKTLSFVEETARLLEYESGGILVAIERVPKGYALIFYRGKNYRRPINIRPRNLLTKAKALKRAVAMQRHEALSQHIAQLENNMKQMKLDLGIEGFEEQEEDSSDSENEDGTVDTSASYDEDQENFDESSDEDEYDDYAEDDDEIDS
ncbi:CRM-domain containing factor CFM3, chloroplastic/mitochondrial-like [Phragmites australis]|uniref:CRM-domain containing factor CFM3, chloroplastic/mitochondrial-like n=1 Tax=Phragmites australis TaxID=29695 RepID=UPI002D77E4A5|nr:CRM-domain containing factor CFM3, chloroplastic/mitochondrial-like [Phragmites australis]XP_062232069.1 CRM-domain containing factor CFM3, chloroplastic/mitochondrial-like [Phragmites australis]